MKSEMRDLLVTCHISANVLTIVVFKHALEILTAELWKQSLYQDSTIPGLSAVCLECSRILAAYISYQAPPLLSLQQIQRLGRKTLG